MRRDAESRITKELVFPDSVTFFKGSAAAIPLPGQVGRRDVVVHGISFLKPHAPESLLPKFKAPVEGAINIALLHTSLAGAEGHDRYAPCTRSTIVSNGVVDGSIGKSWGAGSAGAGAMILTTGPSITPRSFSPDQRNLPTSSPAIVDRLRPRAPLALFPEACDHRAQRGFGGCEDQMAAP